MSTTVRRKKLTHKQGKRRYKLYASLAEGWSRRVDRVTNYTHFYPGFIRELDLIRGTAVLASAIEEDKMTGRPTEVILHVSDCRLEEVEKLEAILRIIGYYVHKRGYDFGKIKAYFRICS